jgi:hypothetical protein
MQTGKLGKGKFHKSEEGLKNGGEQRKAWV